MVNPNQLRCKLTQIRDMVNRCIITRHPMADSADLMLKNLWYLALPADAVPQES